MSETMIEKVARAMAENAGFCWRNCAQSQWKSDARAGIAAMRELTPEMTDMHPPMANKHDFLASYRAMIDAALAEKP